LVLVLLKIIPDSRVLRNYGTRLQCSSRTAVGMTCDRSLLLITSLLLLPKKVPKGSNLDVVIFWDIPQCSPYVNLRFGGTYHLQLHGRKYCLATCYILVSCSTDFTLKMDVISSYVTSVHIRTTRRYILEDGNIPNYRCENIKSYIVVSCLACISTLKMEAVYPVCTSSRLYGVKLNCLCA
jgi:hypothetical protein